LAVALAAASTARADELRLLNERLLLRFAVEGSTLRLAGLSAVGEARDWAAPEPAPSLCRLTLQRLDGRQVRRVALDTATAAGCTVHGSDAAGGQAMRVVWSGLRAPGLEGEVEVTAEVTLPGGSALSQWRVAVRDRVPGWGVESVVFPVFRTAVDATAELASPRGLGKLYRDPAHFAGEAIDIGKGREMGGPYPWGHFAMQLLTLTQGERSLYVSTHDPAGKGKYFYVAPAGEESLEWRLTHYPEEPLRSPCDWSCSYPAVIGIVAGDWWHACRVYREWAVANVEWLRPPPARAAGAPPAWLVSTALQDHSYYEGMDESQGRRALPYLTRQQALLGGLSVLVQYPCWNTRGFDIGYPDFFPARDWYLTDARAARAKGLHYCPYINLLSLDVQSDYWRNGGAEYAFDNGEVWPQLPEKGLVWACPQSDWGPDFAALAGRVARELEAEAIYIDQSGVILPIPCYSRQHRHPPGNQADTAVGVRRILELARHAAQRSNPAIVFSGEGIEECTGIELPLLCNHTLMDMDCPMAMAVYAERLDPYGYMTTLSEYRKDPMSWRTKLAEEFVYGMMVGTAFGRPSEHDTDIIALMRELAGARLAARDYLALGQMMHPPQLTGENPDVTSVWETYGSATRRVTRPTVRASSWLARDGTAAIALASVAERPLSVTWSVKAADLGLTADRLEAQRTWPAGETRRTLVSGLVLQGEVTVPALGAAVVRLSSAGR
jgi:hypothetical protein